MQLICHRTLVKGFQKLGIFKTPDSPGSGSWNSEVAILADGDTAAFFPHGVGHSLGMDVHDVPSASKPAVNPTIITGPSVGPESLYTYLRLRLPLEAGMVVVRSFLLLLSIFSILLKLSYLSPDCGARNLFFPAPAGCYPKL